jgi:hypothetical protein
MLSITLFYHPLLEYYVYASTHSCYVETFRLIDIAKNEFETLAISELISNSEGV